MEAAGLDGETWGEKPSGCSLNEVRAERGNGENRAGLTFGCGGGKELLRSYIRHLEKQEGRHLVDLSN